MKVRFRVNPDIRSAAARLWVPFAAVLLATASPAPAAMVNVDLGGSNATGGLNIVGFDNEINEPNATPPSREHAFEGNGSSHGFAYFKYVYDPANPDAFNDYAGLWSIIISSHPVASIPYYDSVLRKAGAAAYGDLTVNTLVQHPNPGAFSLGSLGYDSALVPGTGTKVLTPAQFTMGVSRQDYNFNILNEPTEPGTWVGYPYYYWGVDNYTLSLGGITGKGLTFVNGKLTSLDFQATVTITSPMAPGVSWEGTLTLSGTTFTYDINESEYVSGLGDLHIVMDRTGTFLLVPEPTAALLLALGACAAAARRRRSPSLTHH